MRRFSWIGLVALAGCGGASTSGGPVYTDLSSPANFVGRTYTEKAAQVLVNGNSGSPTGLADVSVTFVDLDTIDVNVNGTVTRVFYDANDNFFYANDGSMRVDAGTFLDLTNDKYMMLVMIDRINAANQEFFNGMVVGSRTALSDVPTSGSATWSGYTYSQDGQNALDRYRGVIELSADFATGTMSGWMTGALPTDQTATFDLVPVQLSGNRFYTSVTSNDVAVNSSVLDGNLYGPGGIEAGGNFRINTSIGNTAGIFGAVQN